MTEKEYINKIHNEILEIMDNIHAVCSKNNLKYYLTGGSLLGAVRHGGFIPWDDDLDIAMPRNDYNKFLEICKVDLSDKYYCKKIDEDLNYYHIFSKVCKKNTLFLEIKDSDIATNIGIFVDVFPLDETKGISTTVFLRSKILGKILAMLHAKNESNGVKKIKKFISRLFSREFLLKIMMTILCMTNDKGKLYYTNFGSQYPVYRKTQLKTVYGKGTPIDFEGRMYMAPDDYKTDLLSNFGPKYMELPPIEKRRTHYPVKVVFSDGSVFEPTSENDNKVSVKESIDW